MENLKKKVAVFFMCCALPIILYANSENRPIPNELLDISCANTQCSPKIFAAIKSAYRDNTNCGYQFKIGSRLRIVFLNIINSHYRDYHYSIREFCKTGLLPERKEIKNN